MKTRLPGRFTRTSPGHKPGNRRLRFWGDWGIMLTQKDTESTFDSKCAGAHEIMINMTIFAAGNGRMVFEGRKQKSRKDENMWGGMRCSP